MPHQTMINLFVPDTFEGACASVLMHGYAKANGFGVSVRYYKGDCAQELKELKEWIKIADTENAPLPWYRGIFVCSENGFPKRQVRALRRDFRNSAILFGKNYLQKMYCYLRMGAKLSILYGGYFTYWLNEPDVRYFFESVMAGAEHYRIIWETLGSEEFEQFFSDYLHKGETKHG